MVSSDHLPLAPEQLDSGREVLKLVNSYDQRFYRNLIQEYFQVSDVCIVPHAFVESLLGPIIGFEEACSSGSSTDVSSALVEDISAHTRPKPFYGGRGSTASHYFGLFTGRNLRWESLGLFCALVSSSAILLPPRSRFLAGSKDRDNLVSNMVKASTLCVELWRNIGSINEIILLSLYQNLMVISQLYGDKDDRTWRQLLELTSTVSAARLYNGITDSEIPAFLSHLRLCLLAAAYTMDRTICMALGHPPTISCRIFSPQTPLDLVRKLPSHMDEHKEIGVDSWGWLPSGEYCAATWVRLRYTLGVNREMLKATSSIDGEIGSDVIAAILENYTQIWNHLPNHLKYIDQDFDANKRVDRTCFLLASIYLEYLFIKFQAVNGRSQFRLFQEQLAQKIINTILGLNLLHTDGVSLRRGYSSLVFRYGIPAAHILLRRTMVVLIRAETGTDGDDVLWGETIRNLANFIACLHLVTQQQDGNSEALQNARNMLVRNFDTVVDKFGTAKKRDQLVRYPDPWSTSFWKPETFFVEVKDDIWRL